MVGTCIQDQADLRDLSDIRQEGKLSKDEFAVAMHLINLKLAGQDVPTSLPPSLVPPSLRNIAGASTAAAPNAPNAPSSIAQDLFNLFDDAPVSSTPQTRAPPQQPAFPVQQPAFAAAQPTSPSARALSPPPASQSPASFAHANPTFAAPRTGTPTLRSGSSDLLGDDTAPASVPDNSAEIGNKRNQLDNVTRSLDDITKTRSDLETSAATSEKSLSELNTKLSQAREKHETESKAVAELRTRVEEQKGLLKQLQAEVITAESDVSAMRSEKDELEQALLHDKEEVRGLQKKMKEVEDEKKSLMTLLEKLKKESRQQKGMVSIAKKQLSTAEASREGVRTDVDNESAAAAAAATAAAEAPTAASPLSPSLAQRALSPNATGNSQRSNNPFDKFNKNPTGSPTGLAVVGAGAAAAAGVVVAGAETLYHAAKDTVAGSPEVTATNALPAQSADSNVEHQATDDTASAPTQVTEAAAAQQSSTDDSQGLSDFDKAFASFDTPDLEDQPAAHDSETVAGAEPTAVPANTFDDSFASPPATHALPEETVSDEPRVITQDADAEDPFGAPLGNEPTAPEAPTAAASGQSGFDDAFGQTPVPVPASQPAITAATHDADELSSDDDAGPEDLENPTAWRETTSPTPSATLTTRRSAPPPPVRQSTASVHSPAGSPTNQTFDTASTFAPVYIPPAGAQESGISTLPPAPAPSGIPTATIPSSEPPAPFSTKAETVPKAAAFDEDDFDFSDLPPAQIEQANSSTLDTQPKAGTFDDEFAGFDDEFGPSDTSNNSTSLTKSYEMVPPAGGAHPTDEFGAPQQVAQPQSAFSFDDAFGGDFE